MCKAVIKVLHLGRVHTMRTELMFRTQTRFETEAQENLANGPLTPQLP